MKKAILINIRSEWVEKILKGEKTIEIRKTAPKCYLPIDVYIYCAKGNRDLYMDTHHCCIGFDLRGDTLLNGKVVAKFTLEKVSWFEDVIKPMSIVEQSYLSASEVHDYTKGCSFYGWHISNLEVFNDPKELSDFGRLLDKGTYSKADYLNDAVWESMNEVTIQQERLMTEKLFIINKAPQSWQYVEVKE